jgi:hypothetical protein
VVAISAKVIGPRMEPGLPRFLATLGLVLPLSLIGARLFAAVFEIPFTRYRSWSALRDAFRARFGRPAVAAPTSPAAPAGPLAAGPTASAAPAIALTTSAEPE